MLRGQDFIGAVWLASKKTRDDQTHLLGLVDGRLIMFYWTNNGSDMDAFEVSNEAGHAFYQKAPEKAPSEKALRYF